MRTTEDLRDWMNRMVEKHAPQTPRIQERHVDGPLLIMADGRMHWLTLWERALLAMGLTNAERLDRKYRNE